VSALAIIIPTYDALPGDLDAAIASALACENARLVLVIDDGSTPPASTGIRDPRLRLIRQPNGGPSSARNHGLAALAQARADEAKLASIDAAIFLDHDDRLIPSGVAAMVALAEKLEAVAAVGARIEILDDGRRREKPVPGEWADRALPAPDDVFMPKQWFAGTGLLVRGRGLDRAMRFDESLAVVEDRDYVRRLSDIGPIAVCGKPVVEYRIREGASNLSSSKHAATRIRGHLRILEKHWSPPPSLADTHLREATMWLINAASRWPVDRQTWDALTDAARARGWPVPLKARLRKAWKLFTRSHR
jgi:glycosyltransferase involved in cell wall biosynthesis